MKSLRKYVPIALLVAGLGLGFTGCKEKRESPDGFRVKKMNLNSTIIYRYSSITNSCSLHVCKHLLGKSYYLEDYGCDGTVDRIYIFEIHKSFYKVDPVRGEKIEYDKRLFDRADTLLEKYKAELENDEGNSLLKYLD